MKIDFLIFQLAFLFIPGALWAKIDKTFSSKIKPNEFSFVLRSFMFGVISYIFSYLFYLFIGANFPNLDLSKAENSSVINAKTILCVSITTLISVILSFLWVVINKEKLFISLMQKLKITGKYGDEDVWDFVLNKKFLKPDANAPKSNPEEVKFVHLRDLDNKLMYAGFVAYFSETDKDREIFLTDVDVYNSDGGKLYSCPKLYLGLDKNSISMEFPDLTIENVDQNTQNVAVH